MNGVLSMISSMYYTDIPEWMTAESLGHSKYWELTEEDYLNMFRESPTYKPMKVPTLQFLGLKDRRAPARQGLLYDAMTKKHGTHIDTYVYESSNHSLADSVDTSLDIIVKTIMFLERDDWKEEEEKEKKE